MNEKSQFIKSCKARTKQVAVKSIQLVQCLPKTEAAWIVGKQLIRSASSTAANYRAACRSRSQAEFFSKMSIVIEEYDETLFWLELIEEAGIYHQSGIITFKNEITEILKILSKARKTVST